MPRYKDQKDAMLAKIKETTKASDDEIGRNLMGLARARPDVFGTSNPLLSSQTLIMILQQKVLHWPHLQTLTLNRNS